jgi:stearoyl-CoA desaturase (delta-9 desaturase)
MFELSFVQVVFMMLVYSHFSIVLDSIYIHRYLCHGMVSYNKYIKGFFELWMYVTSGTPDPYLAKMHRVHHRTVDTPQDPHSPHFSTKKQILVDWVTSNLLRQYKGAFLHPFKKDPMEKYWQEYEFKFMYNYPYIGVLSFIVLHFVLFGFVGILIPLVNTLMLRLHQFTFGFGLNHMWGYRNYDSPDKSRNCVLFFFLNAAGEEWHNNHHAEPWEINFGRKWWEFDIGYFYMNMLSKIKLAKFVEIKNMPR